MQAPPPQVVPSPQTALITSPPTTDVGQGLMQVPYWQTLPSAQVCEPHVPRWTTPFESSVGLQV